MNHPHRKKNIDNLEELRADCILIEDNLIKILDICNRRDRMHELTKDVSFFSSFHSNCLKMLETNRIQLARLNANIEKRCCSHSFIDDYVDTSPDRGINIKYCEYCFEEM